MKKYTGFLLILTIIIVSGLKSEEIGKSPQNIANKNSIRMGSIVVHRTICEKDAKFVNDVKKQKSNFSFLIYPNPSVKEKFWIIFSSLKSKPLEYVITKQDKSFAINSKFISNTFEINTKDLLSGTYTLTIILENGEINSTNFIKN